MGRALRRTVITGGVTYPAGTPETAALAKKITNPVAWEGEPDAEPAPRKSTSPKKRAATKAADAGETASESSTETAEEPPRGGEGATEDAWRAYATGLGIEVPEDAGRDDIVALVDARGSDQ